MRRFAAYRKAVSAAVWIALLATVALCQTPSEVTRELEPGFQDRAMAHVRHLAAFGERVAGGEGEAKALAYIRSQMVEMGLEVVVEPFEFQSFVLESAGITAGSNYAEVIRLGFNPYAGGDRRAGELAFVESTDSVGALQKTDLDDKIVVTTPNGNLYVLSMFHRPRAIVSVSATDFQRLQAAGLRSGEVTFRGKITKLRSANIVGTLPSAPSTGRVIILSAHYDSNARYAARFVIPPAISIIVHPPSENPPAAIRLESMRAPNSGSTSILSITWLRSVALSHHSEKP